MSEPQVTGFQFYIDTLCLQGDGTRVNPIRIVPITVDPTVAPGVPAPAGTLAADPSATPATLMLKSTDPDPTAWIQLLPVPVAQAGQAFVYNATGLEGADFVVALPVAQPDVDYIATVTGIGLAAMLLFDCPQADFAVGQIRVLASGALTAGDKLAITITPCTA